MTFHCSLITAACVALISVASAADPAPTLMTLRGPELVSQEFGAPLPPFDGKSNGFASGFKAWRYNSAKRGGLWVVDQGVFRGSESTDPTIKHPATASYGFPFSDVVIQCEVRMLDVPLNGRAARYVQVRTTDTKDYVCSLVIKPDGWRIEKSDNDHGGPDKPVTLGEVKTPIKPGDWVKVQIEILGQEMLATVNGRTLTGSHPLIASAKHSVMFVSGGDSEVRHFHVWQASANPEWNDHKKGVLTNRSK